MAHKPWKALSVYAAVYTGQVIDLCNPDPTQLRIEVIARCLSRICRFGAKTLSMYSVAQHCISVASLCHGSVENQLWGLLHDAHEAYTGDFISPIKKIFPEIKEWEEEVWIPAIAKAFNLPLPIPKEVVDSDRYMLAYERKYLLPAEAKIEAIFIPYENGIKPKETSLFCMSEQDAEREYLRRFFVLTGLRETS